MSHIILETVEKQMILNDARFHLGLFSNIHKKENIGILILSITPYWSLFVIESYKYFQKVDPVFAVSIKRTFEPILESSRNQIKLFDEKFRKVKGMISFIDEITQSQYKSFILTLTEPFLATKLQLATDLGLYKYYNHIICTTHVALFNVGYEPNIIQEDMSTTSRSIGIEIGEYFRKIHEYFSIDIDDVQHELFHYDIPSKSIASLDVKSKEYYYSIFTGTISSEINAALTLAQATLNYLRYIFPLLIKGEHETYFKIKFINLYHIISSIKKLNIEYNGILDINSKAYITKILDDSILTLLLSQVPFRNILIHYGIRKINESDIDTNKKFFGLVEYFYPSYTFEALNRILDQQIVRISELLNSWASMN